MNETLVSKKIGKEILKPGMEGQVYKPTVQKLGGQLDYRVRHSPEDQNQGPLGVVAHTGNPPWERWTLEGQKFEIILDYEGS